MGMETGTGTGTRRCSGSARLPPGQVTVTATSHLPGSGCSCHILAGPSPSPRPRAAGIGEMGLVQPPGRAGGRQSLLSRIPARPWSRSRAAPRPPARPVSTAGWWHHQKHLPAPGPDGNLALTPLPEPREGLELPKEHSQHTHRGSGHIEAFQSGWKGGNRGERSLVSLLAAVPPSPASPGPAGCSHIAVPSPGLSRLSPSLLGQSPARAGWRIPGGSLEHPWSTPGTPLEHPWNIPGARLGHPWSTPGAGKAAPGLAPGWQGSVFALLAPRRCCHPSPAPLSPAREGLAQGHPEGRWQGGDRAQEGSALSRAAPCDPPGLIWLLLAPSRCHLSPPALPPSRTDALWCFSSA